MSENEKEIDEAGGAPQRSSIALERLQIGSVLLAVAFAFLFNIVAQSFFNAILCELFPRISLNDWYEWLIAGIPLYCISMPLSLVFFAMGRKSPDGRREGVAPWVWTVTLAICLALTYAGSLLGVLVNLLIGGITGVIPENGLDSLASSAPLWENLLFLGILAPVMEELFFRKLVIDRLRRYGDVPAIIFSGLAFGLIHGNFSQFFYATFLGMLFGAIYIHTGKLRHTIFLHMVVNFMGGFYTTVMIGSPAEELMTTILSMLYLISLVLTIPALLYVSGKIKLQKGSVRLDHREARRVRFFNLGLWLSVLFLLANFATSLLLS